MVVRVEYHIPKKYFVKNKEQFKRILHKEVYEISVLKFEKEMAELEIAKQTRISYFKVRKLLSFVCERYRKMKDK